MPVLLTIRCPKSRQASVRWLLERGLLVELEGGYGANLSVVPDLLGIQSVLEVVRAVQRIRGASVELEGVRVDPLKVAAVLDCYAQSLQVSDPRAHCWVVSPRPDGLLLPCRLAAPYLNCTGLGKHPSPVRAQVESALVLRGCAWCPQLRVNEWEVMHATGPDPDSWRAGKKD